MGCGCGGSKRRRATNGRSTNVPNGSVPKQRNMNAPQKTSYSKPVARNTNKNIFAQRAALRKKRGF